MRMKFHFPLPLLLCVYAHVCMIMVYFYLSSVSFKASHFLGLAFAQSRRLTTVMAHLEFKRHFSFCYQRSCLTRKHEALCAQGPQSWIACWWQIIEQFPHETSSPIYLRSVPSALLRWCPTDVCRMCVLHTNLEDFRNKKWGLFPGAPVTNYDQERAAKAPKHSWLGLV